MKALRGFLLGIFGLLLLATLTWVVPSPVYPIGLPLRPGQATAVSGAASLNQDAGTITSESLTTVAGATYTLTVGCNAVTSNSVIQASLSNGTNSAGDPAISTITPTQTPGGAAFVVVVTNRHATNALNGTLKIAFVVFN
jgi:hypothetical protein